MSLSTTDVRHQGDSYTGGRFEDSTSTTANHASDRKHFFLNINCGLHALLYPSNIKSPYFMHESILSIIFVLWILSFLKDISSTGSKDSKDIF